MPVFYTPRMNLSSIPFTSRLGKLLRLPLRVVPKRAVVPVLQGELRGMRWIVGSSTHGCWLGTYEHQTQRLFASLVPANGTVYDIGANVGFYTLLAATRAKRVIAVEPLAENVAYLKRHLDLNGVFNVEVWPAAVADKEGEEPFAAAGDRSQGTLGAEGPMVRTITLDRLCEICGPPALIKVDVEGAEYRVLQGAQKCLAEHRSTILMSTHSISLHLTCLTLLTNSGYDVQQVGNDGLLARGRPSAKDGLGRL